MKRIMNLDDYVCDIGITVAFTGPRPYKLPPYNGDISHPNIIRIIDELKYHTEKLNKDFGFTRFLSGLSTGVDMWAARGVLDLKEKYTHSDIELYAFIPFEDQPAKWSQEERDEYFYILSCCTGIVYVSRNYHRYCYRDRDQAMVSCSKGIIAVDDPSVHAPRSGTRMTVNMGKRNGNQFWFISPG